MAVQVRPLEWMDVCPVCLEVEVQEASPWKTAVAGVGVPSRVACRLDWDYKVQCLQVVLPSATSGIDEWGGWEQEAGELVGLEPLLQQLQPSCLPSPWAAFSQLRKAPWRQPPSSAS